MGARTVRDAGRGETHHHPDRGADERAILEGVTLLDADDIGPVESSLDTSDQQHQRIGTQPEQFPRRFKARAIKDVDGREPGRRELRPAICDGLATGDRRGGRQHHKRGDPGAANDGAIVSC